jgi:hypothetical protein
VEAFPPLTLSTAHVTAVLLVPLTCALNRIVAPGITVALD